MVSTTSGMLTTMEQNIPVSNMTYGSHFINCQVFFSCMLICLLKYVIY